MSEHPAQIGTRSEAIVLAALVRLDVAVSIPFGHNHRYDFIVDSGPGLLRVQCKTGRLRGSGSIVFSTKSVRSNSKGAYLRPYDGDADLFAVYCPENEEIYAVDVIGAALGSASLRVSPSVNGQTSGIRWACDHRLADVLRRGSSVGRATNL